MWKISTPISETFLTTFASEKSLGEYKLAFCTEKSNQNCLAIGVQDWKVVNDNDIFCSDSQTLSLSPCTLKEFNCDDGSCISMEKRCNQVSECSDESDEFNCMTFPIMKQYQVSLFFCC